MWIALVLRLALTALIFALPAAAAPKVCATVDATVYPHDQFGDVEPAKYSVERIICCVRVSDDRKTASASLERFVKGQPNGKPFVYPDLSWNPKTKRWERRFQAVINGVRYSDHYSATVQDKGDRYTFTLAGEGADGATTIADVPKPKS